MCHSPSSSLVVTRSFTSRTYIDLSLSNNFPYTASVQSSPDTKEEEEKEEEEEEEERRRNEHSKEDRSPPTRKKISSIIYAPEVVSRMCGASVAINR